MKVQEIKANELHKKINEKNPIFILDVRNEQAFKELKIEEDHVNYLNVPYFDLLDGVEGILAQLPQNEQVIVACMKGKSSLVVAEMLANKGVNVASLSGGME